MTKKNNVSFWNKFKTIPKSRQKPYKGKGGFQGTSYDAMYLFEALTAEYGPIGDTWGYEIQDHFYCTGSDKDGNQFGTINVVVKVWCPDGYTYGAAANELYFANKYGFSSDEEAFKKAVTDAVKKGFSHMGFAADLWLDKYQDRPVIPDVEDQMIETDAEPKNKDESKATCEVYLKALEDLIADKKPTGLNKGFISDRLKAAEAKYKEDARLLTYEKGKIKKRIQEIRTDWEIEG